jgi:hypothetical protein
MHTKMGKSRRSNKTNTDTQNKKKVMVVVEEEKEGGIFLWKQSADYAIFPPSSFPKNSIFTFLYASYHLSPILSVLRLEA